MEGFNKNLIEYNKEKDFIVLSPEEIALLDDNERSLYYENLSKKAESDDIKHNQEISEINQEELDELYQGENDNTEEFNKYNRIKEEKERNPNINKLKNKNKFKKDNSLRGIFRRDYER